MKVLVQRNKEGEKWFIRLGRKHPEPKYSKLEYTMSLTFDYHDDELWLREEYSQPPQYMNLVDYWPPLAEKEIDRGTVFKHIKRYLQKYLNQANEIYKGLVLLEALQDE